MRRVVNIIYTDEKDNLVFPQEGKDALRTIPPNSVLLVSGGPARGGKSSMLGLLIPTPNDDFKTSNSINSYTKGINMHMVPQEIGGRKVWLFDVEGIGDPMQNQEHDRKVSIMALLLSSLFLFQSTGYITQHAIETLSSLVTVADEINAKNENQFQYPELCWVLRDVLSLGGESEQQYLERALSGSNKRRRVDESTEEPKQPEIHSGDSSKAAIRSAFKTRTCMAFPMPSPDVRNVNISLHRNKIVKPFMNKLDELKRLIARAPSKRFGGILIGGEQLALFCEKYVASLNEKGSIPDLASFRDMFIAITNENALSDILGKWKSITQVISKFIDSKGPMTPVLLRELMDGKQDAAMRSFLARTKNADENKARSAFASVSGEVWDKNTQLCSQLVSAAMSEASKPDEARSAIAAQLHETMALYYSEVAKLKVPEPKDCPVVDSMILSKLLEGGGFKRDSQDLELMKKEVERLHLVWSEEKKVSQDTIAEQQRSLLALKTTIETLEKEKDSMVQECGRARDNMSLLDSKVEVLTREITEMRGQLEIKATCELDRDRIKTQCDRYKNELAKARDRIAKDASHIQSLTSSNATLTKSLSSESEARREAEEALQKARKSLADIQRALSEANSKKLKDDSEMSIDMSKKKEEIRDLTSKLMMLQKEYDQFKLNAEVSSKHNSALLLTKDTETTSLKEKMLELNKANFDLSQKNVSLENKCKAHERCINELRQDIEQLRKEASSQDDFFSQPPPQPEPENEALGDEF